MGTKLGNVAVGMPLSVTDVISWEVQIWWMNAHLNRIGQIEESTQPRKYHLLIGPILVDQWDIRQLYERTCIRSD
jgi:hypothetical protein